MIGTAEQIAVFLLRQEDRKKLYEIKEHRERRSLDSNAYFHVLCDKLRQAVGVSMARMKNTLVADYGQIEYIDDEPMIYKTNAPEEYMIEREEPHTKCIKVSEENGRAVYFYRVYRPTRTYNVAEMAALISGTVQECHQVGIETATERELAIMAERWGKKCTSAQNSVL